MSFFRKKNKIIFFGPKTEPVTGQNICFNSILNFYSSDVLVVDTTRLKNRLLSAFYCNFLFFYFINIYPVKTVYLTGSRSWFGVLKEISIYFLKFYNYKLINHIHGYNIKDVNETNFILLKPISYLLRNIPDIFIILNSQLEKHYSNVRGEICIVDNFYSKSFDRKIDFNQKLNHIVYLSNIIESKGIFVLLESIKSVFSSNDDWKVFIAGSFLGNKKNKKKFTEKINELNLKFPNKIFYKGVLNEKEKIDLLSTSKVFVLPSFYKTECVPLSIIESMRTGNHIIVSRHNILPSIVSPNGSSLVEVKNANSLSESLLEVIKNKEMQKKSFEFNINLAKSRYTEDVYLEKLKKIIG